MRDSLSNCAEGCGFPNIFWALLKFHIFSEHVLKAKLGANSSQRFVEVDGFGNVIDGSGFETFELAFFDNAQAFAAVVGEKDLHALPFELPLEQLIVYRLIFEDEYLGLWFLTQNGKRLSSGGHRSLASKKQKITVWQQPIDYSVRFRYFSSITAVRLIQSCPS